MIQIHQLKLKSIKEIEKTNNIQSKQKKKYGEIKSRFLDVFNKQKKILKIINSKSTLKMNNNIYKNFNFNKHKDQNKKIRRRIIKLPKRKIFLFQCPSQKIRNKTIKKY